ncbi:small subunit rRNA processing KH domain protein, putative [Plasmodium knowlesi strain H]|uniref:Small subunit rRNA processing KH domain protein, putative n=3 Tax=Plasmodium knowlesi TaxID=5850 RepID=A0A5K1VAH5_PLAKH|nr:pre-rRNA-processing protein PNO1, putative [Plasmodium knowlesi strain H]OTN65525.1 putative Nucleic acid binding protein [Plasmodium knowlesi]CAA9989443.1 pre-rRNA-processing protein PNO1, putative [Plasmodium knowlesi strain H]SBO25073.1 small subunit rRNA processing KH domain protein, putative [Plasmodium knowlesi strain H]SBO27830.1 small subunit rRNA processing KH domain protein, putative [Plasmodium knowlesi strain H]VVS78917.1 pre-rRNA-processing protein PNO1, putative [Plasmodium kn|eukprot:XP_002260169.1 nucleic acid binding protein, putative [Plasmodium knowlesi strain H]
MTKRMPNKASSSARGGKIEKKEAEKKHEEVDHEENSNQIEQPDNGNTRNILTMENILEEKDRDNNKKVKNKIILKNRKNTSSTFNNNEMRILTIPKHRISSIKTNWMELIKPIVTHLKLEIRMVGDKIQVRTCKLTEDKNNLQKSSDYIKAYLLGFTIEDSLALLRIDDLYIESFQVKDVKILKGDHLSRCIGRICGSNGATKYAIENATKTRIVIAGDKIHILGSFNNIKMARYSICSLILGSTQGKIFNKLNILAKRMKERF